MATRQWRALGRVVGRAAAFIAITFGLFLLFEGGASLLIFVRALQTETEPVLLVERGHTEYDPQLGWINRPGVRIDDMYGPGKHLAINGQGFRNQEDFAPEVPPATLRVICSGDSFTLGHGVANKDTWCARLAALSPGVQTVNMGQAGYGVDQAYLWYLRDGLKLEHHVQVLAFIYDDFRRVGENHFFGYGKPFMVAEEDGLRVIPARRNGGVYRWLINNGHLFLRLRSVLFLGRAIRKLADRERAEALGSRRARTWHVVEAIFDDLRERHRRGETQLILLALPAPWDRDTELSTDWRQFVDDYARRTGVPYVDLVEEYRAMGPNEARALFFPPGEIGSRHLNETGHLWVAKRLVTRLGELLGGQRSIDAIDAPHRARRGVSRVVKPGRRRGAERP